MTDTTLRSATGWTVDASTFSARLALIRLKMGWNVKEAARACGLPAATWRAWEMDGMTPRRQVDVARQISGSTGCDYLWLLLGPGHGDDGGSTRQYFAPARLVATAGTTDNPSGRRPVRRTRPRATARPALVRPVTPVAA